MFSILVDDNVFLLSVTKLYSKSRCLLKLNYEINIEGIKMSLLRQKVGGQDGGVFGDAEKTLNFWPLYM